MGTSPEEEYSAFLEKVERTIYVDNLSPLVTEPVLRSALDQFGNVKSIQFIPVFLGAKNMPLAALVEMENSKQAGVILAEMTNYPFMIKGMPRPVTSCAARVEMFDDRPRKPGRNIVCRWLDPEDPEFEAAKKVKNAVRRHAAEASALLEQQRAEEEKLASQQSEIVKAQCKKYDLLQTVFEDGSAERLGRYYGMPLLDG